MSARAAPEPWRGTPLPRGRHKLRKDVVRASQRERLLRAMLECVGERGYSATTVPQVVAAARVSRNSFYDFFDDKLGCFLALCDEVVATGLFEAVASAAVEPTWRGAVDRGMEAYLRYWQDRPAFSRAYLVEIPTAGEKAIEQRDRQSKAYLDLFAALGARARAEEPDLPPLPKMAPRLLVVGITAILAEEVRAGRVGRLVSLTPQLAETVAAVLAGDADAA